MRTTTVSFKLLEWRGKLDLTQREAAKLLGMSFSGYRAAEYRSMDREGHPVNKTVALLARRIEKEAKEAAKLAKASRTP